MRTPGHRTDSSLNIEKNEIKKKKEKKKKKIIALSFSKKKKIASRFVFKKYFFFSLVLWKKMFIHYDIYIDLTFPYHHSNLSSLKKNLCHC
jgi:hypothetical protein